MKDFVSRDGAVRAFMDGYWVQANPGDPLFSTLIMFATEYWENKRWNPIHLELEPERNK